MALISKIQYDPIHDKNHIIDGLTKESNVTENDQNTAWTPVLSGNDALNFPFRLFHCEKNPPHNFTKEVPAFLVPAYQNQNFGDCPESRVRSPKQE